MATTSLAGAGVKAQAPASVPAGASVVATATAPAQVTAPAVVGATALAPASAMAPVGVGALAPSTATEMDSVVVVPATTLLMSRSIDAWTSGSGWGGGLGVDL